MFPKVRKLRPFHWMVLSFSILITGVGCQTPWGIVDPYIAIEARRALYSQELPTFDEFEDLHGEDIFEDEGGGTVGEAIVGELLAIFPGVLIHGMGHWYAGDRKTARQLSRIGQFGYLLTAVGGGLGVGGHFLWEEDLKGTAISLYTTGAIVGTVGATYFFTAWIYDMIDTPRAVLSGGKPPPHSTFVESLDFFDD